MGGGGEWRRGWLFERCGREDGAQAAGGHDGGGGARVRVVPASAFSLGWAGAEFSEKAFGGGSAVGRIAGEGAGHEAIDLRPDASEGGGRLECPPGQGPG